MPGPIEPTQLLSNGRYSVTLRANGAGCQPARRARDHTLVATMPCGMRWAVSSTCAGTGSRRRCRSPSIRQPDPAAQYASTFHADRVSFEADWPELQARMTVWVSPEDDVEFRQVELRNLSGDRPLDIELISAFEATLADPRADEAHAAFSNLFVRASVARRGAARCISSGVRAWRPSTGLQAAHFLSEERCPQVQGLRVQTDRQRWRGRNTAASQPLAGFDAAAARIGGRDPAVHRPGPNVRAVGAPAHRAARQGCA